MNLPPPPAQYDPSDQSQVRRETMQADGENVKLKTVLDKFYMRDTATGAVKTIVITSGAFVIS